MFSSEKFEPKDIELIRQNRERYPTNNSVFDILEKKLPGYDLGDFHDVILCRPRARDHEYLAPVQVRDWMPTLVELYEKDINSRSSGFTERLVTILPIVPQFAKYLLGLEERK